MLLTYTAFLFRYETFLRLGWKWIGKGVSNILHLIGLEFIAVIVLPTITITHNYGIYLYSNYVGYAPVGKVIT